MSFKKELRKAIYAKYGGRCAYCGHKIHYEDMQIDHFIPKNGHAEQGTDAFENLMPSCRMCNHYKRANSISLFRRYIEEIPRKLRGDYIYKVGLKYGLIVENEHPIKFYFEVENDGESHT